MELDIIKLQTTWNDAAGSLNNNFAKISQAINTGSGGGGGGSSYDDTELRELIDTKQEELVSGGNIKTINGQDVLGSGNLEVGSVAGVDVGEEVDDVETHYATEEYVDSAIEGKQDTLISGENIKTINGQSVLGSGNITIQGGGSSYDDTELRNSLNAVTERVEDLSSEIEDKVNETSIATINGQNLVNGGNVVVGDVVSVATGDVVDDVNIRYATEAYVDEAIANLEIGGGSYDDTELREELSRKADVDGVYPEMTVGMTRDMLGVGEGDEGEFLFRPTDGDGSIKDGFASIERIEGSSVVWNQLSHNRASKYGVNGWSFADSSIDGLQYNNALNQFSFEYGNRRRLQSLISVKANHKYLVLFDLEIATSNTYNGEYYVGYFSGNNAQMLPKEDISLFVNKKKQVTALVTSIADNTYTFIGLYDAPLASSDIEKISNIKVIDLTRMFGAGNEPLTLEEFYQRIPKGIDINAYNEGEVVNMNVEGIKSVGFNAWDEQWELGTITEEGVDYPSQAIFRPKGYIKVLPNTQYAITSPSHQVLYVYYFDSNKGFISFKYFERVLVGEVITTPANCAYLRFIAVLGTTYNNDICINLVHTGYRNGEYEPYVSDEIALPISEYFPSGMKAIGDIRDEITATQAIQRIGVVDLGTLDWTKMEANGYEGFKSANNNLGAMPINHLNEVLCSLYTKAGTKWYDEGLDKCIDINNGYYGSTANSDFIVVRDTSYTDTASFKSAMSGVMLYYELAEPIVTTFDKPLDLDYQVWDFGTEEAITEGKTTPLKASIIYEFNARDTIRANKLALKNKADKTYVDNAIAQAIISTINANY